MTTLIAAIAATVTVINVFVASRSLPLAAAGGVVAYLVVLEIGGM